MDACDIINIKPSRIGGLADSKRVHDLAQENGIAVWHGGMLEAGIGRAFSVCLASFTLPGDIVHNPFTLNDDSTLAVPTAPGCGAEVDEAYLSVNLPRVR